MSEGVSADTRPRFPLVDANLLLPEVGAKGEIGICSNTLAPGQVYNEIGESNRPNVPVLGTLIVSRDGAERLVLNSLAHPSLRHVVLFAEESTSFAPSTNLLLALINGIDPEGGKNRIISGLGSSAQYPNLTPETFEAFRKDITILPLFVSRRPSSGNVAGQYIEGLAARIPKEILDFLLEHAGKNKIYYDALNDLVEALGGIALEPKPALDLDPKTYQHLQPPVIEIKTPQEKQPLPEVPFAVRVERELIEVQLNLPGHEPLKIRGNDEFDVAFTIMKLLGGDKELLAPAEQLILGAEIGRAGVLMRNNLEFEPLSIGPEFTEIEAIPSQQSRGLKTDKDYYYRVGSAGDEVSVMCLAHDVCEEVFDLRGSDLLAMLQKLAELNRFEAYEMDILHRLDIGTQTARAFIAKQKGCMFMQDFAPIFRENTTDLPFVFVESDTFLGAHSALLTRVYTEGLTAEHADKQKGVARTLGALVVFRTAAAALEEMPRIYQQGDQPTAEARAAYAAQLLRFDHDGDYSYGERTRTHFGFDQLYAAISELQSSGQRSAIVQRFDPSVDMRATLEEAGGKVNYSHDPCLTHDVFWLDEAGKLHSFHIARAHNFVNAYPDNLYGLHDAYVKTIAHAIDAPIGDMFMLSNRGNILLLSEEQRAKTLIAEPSKPFERDNIDESSGPFSLQGQQAFNFGRSVKYLELDGLSSWDATLIDHSVIQRLRDYRGIDTIDRAIDYLQTKGTGHNNPILSTYYAGESDPHTKQLLFFQANEYAGKIYATAVYTGGDAVDSTVDSATARYLAQLFATSLNSEVGKVLVFYVPA